MAVDLTALNNDYDLLLAFPLIEENIVATAKWFEGINPIGGVSDGVKRWSTSGYVERYQGSTSSFVPLEWSKVVFGTSFGIVDDADIGLTISLDGSNQTLLDAANGLLLRVNGTDVIKAYASGFAGVNTANPAYAWDVTGDINFTGNLYNNGSAVSLVTQTYVDAADTNLQSQITTLGTTDTSLQNQITTLGTTDTSLQTQITTLTSVIAQTSANFRGEWSSATTYQQYDQVLRNGIRYYSQVSSNLNNDPASSPTQWSLFVNVFSGNVGIGTSSPSAKLDIFGANPVIEQSYSTSRPDADEYIAGGLESYFLTRDSNNNLGAYIHLKDVSTNSSFPTAIRGGEISFGTIDGGTGFSGNPAIERMRITADGKVGIGTSSPSDLLDVEANDATAYSASGSNPIIQVGNINTSANTNFSSIQMFTDGNSRGLVNLNALSNTTINSADFSIQTRHNATIAERMRISSDGKVGIGTSEPRAKLSLGIGGTAAAPAFILSNDVDTGFYRPAENALGFTTAGVSRMVIKNDGNVGIGTSAPVKPLDVRASQNGLARFYSTSPGGSCEIEFLTLNSASTVGKISKISATQVGAETNGSILSFSTSPTTSNTPTARMTIDSSGKVGIGTSAPDARLEIAKANTSTGLGSGGLLQLTNTSGSAFDQRAEILFKNTGQITSAISSSYTSFSSPEYGGELVFATKHHTDTEIVEQMRIDSSGNVGIGTSAPKAKLDVSGVIEAGTASSISGSTMLRNRYVGNDYTCNFGAMQSSGAGMIGYAVAPKNGSAGFVSSADVANFARAALEVSADLKYSTATNESTTVGDDVTLDTKFIVKNDGNVGIGTSAPTRKLTLYQSNSDGSFLQFTNQTTGVAITDGSHVGINNSEDLEIAQLETGKQIQFYNGGTRRLVIDSAGDVEVKTGNLVISTAGKGIDFSATSGTGTSELLDDYEEGTWTPVIADAGTGGNTATGNFVGTYTKVGRKVTATGQCRNINTTGLTSTNDLFIRSLPFINGINMAQYGTVRIEYASFSGYCVFMVYGLTTYAKVIEVLPNAQNDALTPADLTSGTSFINFTVTYETS